MSEEINGIEMNDGMASEPLAACVTESFGCNVRTVHDETDDLDWSQYPVFGPKTEEEAIARVEQAWEERNDNSKWMTSEQMWNSLYDKYPWLR